MCHLLAEILDQVWPANPPFFPRTLINYGSGCHDSSPLRPELRSVAPRSPRDALWEESRHKESVVAYMLAHLAFPTERSCLEQWLGFDEHLAHVLTA